MGVMPDEPVRLGLEEYLRFEEVSEARHQLIRGEVLLMSSGTERHDLLAQLVNAEFFAAYRGTGCRVFTHNRKLLIPAKATVYYPDVFVTCARSAHRLYESDANIIVEITSPSNPPRELIEKLFDYQTLPSIETILYLEPDKRVLTVHRRAGAVWTETQVSMGGVSVGKARLDVDAIFAEVDATAVAD
jgi:Uma2 family endonuclease